MEYGLIGEKLGHSFSKFVHTELCGYDYSLCEISKGELDSFMKKKEFKAINVTIPYKQDVIPYLDQIDEIAKQIGAVNTVVNKNGKLYGYNTDFLGLSALIKRAEINLCNKKVLILGSGGTSKTAFCVAKSLGARQILKVSRNSGEGLITYSEAVLNHSDAEIIINTTPSGMYPDIDNAPINIEKFENLLGVVDVIYNPLCSQLVVSAKEKGIKAVGGLYMLVSQGVFAAEKFTGTEIPESETERVYKKLLKEKRNLVLIGMPSCGKTTVGKAVSKALDMEFIDSDELIVKKTGMSIPEIFKTMGEKGFREIESKVIAEISLLQNKVIATGGGVVLNNRNTKLLKANGFVVFLDRPLGLLVTTLDRPLSSDRKALEKRYNERYDIYCKSADAIIDASGSIEENISAVKEVLSYENFSY